MADLKTDYVDDELDVEVNTRRKFRMITNQDGTVSFEDVTVYSKNGDDYGSVEINEQNTKINQINNDLSVNMIGVIFAYGGSVAPNNFLLCDGSAISRTTYAKLFAVIGESYGSGDGSTTFNLPDCREVALVGVGTNSTYTIASHDTYTLGEFKDDQMQTHTHSAHTDSWSYAQWASSGMPSSKTQSSGINTGRRGDVTRGKRLGANYIIKYQ